MCVPHVQVWPDRCLQVSSEFEGVERVDHAQCSTPHVTALVLPALMAPLTHTLALFPGPTSFSSSAVCGAAV